MYGSTDFTARSLMIDALYRIAVVTDLCIFIETHKLMKSTGWVDRMDLPALSLVSSCYKCALCVSRRSARVAAIMV